MHLEEKSFKYGSVTAKRGGENKRADRSEQIGTESKVHLRLRGNSTGQRVALKPAGEELFQRRGCGSTTVVRRPGDEV